LELILSLDERKGSAWLSQEMWQRMGDVTGWSLTEREALAWVLHRKLCRRTTRVGDVAAALREASRCDVPPEVRPVATADKHAPTPRPLVVDNDRRFVILSTKWSTADKNRGDHLVWWGPDSSGYTPALNGPSDAGYQLAGRYTAEEARRICDGGDGTEPVLYQDAIALSFHLIPADSGKVRRLTEAGRAALRGSTGAG
jgi:hypothetical protein